MIRRALAAGGAAWLACGVAWAQDGAALFVQHCGSCHQADASGTVGLAPALKGEHWGRLGADRAYIPNVVVHGLSGAIRVNGQPFVGAMPGLGPQLDDAALAAIATHLRALQGAKNEAPYAADEIRAVRQTGGNPAQTRERRVRAIGG